MLVVIIQDCSIARKVVVSYFTVHKCASQYNDVSVWLTVSMMYMYLKN